MGSAAANRAMAAVSNVSLVFASPSLEERVTPESAKGRPRSATVMAVALSQTGKVAQQEATARADSVSMAFAVRAHAEASASAVSTGFARASQAPRTPGPAMRHRFAQGGTDVRRGRPDNAALLGIASLAIATWSPPASGSVVTAHVVGLVRPALEKRPVNVTISFARRIRDAVRAFPGAVPGASVCLKPGRPAGVPRTAMRDISAISALENASR